MQFSDSSSWRFAEGGSQPLNIALWIRDAAGLSVLPGPDGAPRLLERPPPVQVGAPQELSAQWASWWRRLVRYEADEARMQPATAGEDARTRMYARGERLRIVFDPPEFGSLAGMPELRDVVTGNFEDAARLTGTLPPEGGDSMRPAFAWAIVNDAVRSAAAEREVPLGSISGVVVLLDVVGRWSYRAGPGFWLCSRALAADPDAGPVLLRQVLLSGLG